MARERYAYSRVFSESRESEVVTILLHSVNFEDK